MTWLLLFLHVLLISGFSLRILLRDDLRPDVRMGWLTVMVLVPYAGCVLYYLFGEAALGRLGSDRQHKRYPGVAAFVRRHLPARQAWIPFLAQGVEAAPAVNAQWQPAFDYASSINGFAVTTGNHAQLMRDGNQARARMLADMDAACSEIHVLYYIWLDDETGTALAQALMRAARRGVTCRAMVDGLGSRALIGSPLWQQMQQAGVQLAVALPVNRPLKVILTSRIDLRNHRKITVIDGTTGYCGSQNCADEAFAVKARYAPWVDIMLRLQGPVVAQMQMIFASDWRQASGKSLAPLLPPADLAGKAGFAALAIAEGPNERRRSTPHLVSTLLASARHEVVISTPYFVPDATVLEALCATALRGVAVTLIVPARNDSWIVGAASRSNYRRLLAAGVGILEFRPGLLHAKTLCVDGEVALVGSTNLDLRSFDLNFESNVLLHDRALTAAIRARQQAYADAADTITMEQVLAWRWSKRIWHNLLATLSPVL
ncbi:cardiolipin synthase [Comamonas composti]|uniref:cardiolipin synthase n=1 Tax=Comamonas composti TaxID=408558 RepID=UPI000409AD73|nr:cardiolipin synthase [Comamonas composti]